MDDIEQLQSSGFEPVDLGRGVYISLILDPEGNEVGVHNWHRCQDGSLVAGTVWFDNEACNAINPKASKWTVEQREPLTLYPSVLCAACGLHGWIRNGRWEPA